MGGVRIMAIAIFLMFSISGWLHTYKQSFYDFSLYSLWIYLETVAISLTYDRLTSAFPGRSAFARIARPLTKKNSC